MKFGALIGAFPMFLISFVIAVGDVRALGRRRGCACRSPAAARPPEAAAAVVPRLSDGVPPGCFEQHRAGTPWRRPFPPRGDTETSTHRSAIATADAPVSRRRAGRCRRVPAAVSARPRSISVRFRHSTWHRPGIDQHTEMERVRWMSAVSGGSYIASAWVSARAARRLPQPCGALVATIRGRGSSASSRFLHRTGRGGEILGVPPCTARHSR